MKGQVINVSTHLNIRKGPSINYSVINTLHNNQIIDILEKVTNGTKIPWYQIKYKNEIGYVRSDYIKILKETSNDILVSHKLIEFIKSFEGFYSTPYIDIAGVKTIGFGSTNGPIMRKEKVTREEALNALIIEVNNMAKQIKADLDSKGVILTQNEFDSLCSFAYNCGVTALLKESTLYKRICNGVRDNTLQKNFEAWSHVGKKVVNGLLRRRRKEFKIFNANIYENNN